MRGLLGVSSAIWRVGQLLPVCPDKRTIPQSARTSRSGQELSFAVAKLLTEYILIFS